MNIIKNGFYKLSEIYNKNIDIKNNLIINIFDDINKDLIINIGEKTTLNFYSLIEEEKNTEIIFTQKSKDSILNVNYLILGNNSKKIKTKIHSKIEANNVKSNINILSMVLKDSCIDLDGIIEIVKGVTKIKCFLKEDNIFLGDGGKIKGIPTLLVASSDIDAGHSCKIEKINNDKLFYLRSRGINKESAISLMVEAKIKNIFFDLSKIDNTLYIKLLDNIFKKL